MFINCCKYKKKSVWQYGVYTQAGAEYTGATATRKAPFPIYDVAGSKELRGYASHWGVHVDYESRMQKLCC